MVLGGTARSKDGSEMTGESTASSNSGDAKDARERRPDLRRDSTWVTFEEILDCKLTRWAVAGVSDEPDKRGPGAGLSAEGAIEMLQSYK